MPSSRDLLRQYVEQRQSLDQAGMAERLLHMVEAHRSKCSWFHAQAIEGHAYGGGGGEQWDPTVLQRLEEEDRPALVVDKVSTTIDALTGRLQTDRFRAQVAPEGIDEPLAGPLDAYCTEMRRRSGGEAESDDAFRDMWLGRVGWERITLRYRGPTPEEVRETIPLWEMIWDTRARKQNLRDRRFQVHARHVNATEFRAKFGDPKIQADDGSALGTSTTFFALWNDQGSDSSDAWPLNVQDSWNADEETVFLKTVEWRDTEPFVYLRLPESLDAAIVESLGGARHTDASVTEAISKTLVSFGPPQEEGGGSPLAGLAAEPPARLGWSLTPEDFLKLDEVWKKATSETIPAHLWRRLQRERFYRGNMVGDHLLGKAELIPEQRFTFIALTDNMIKSPQQGHLPRSYIMSMKDRQDALNKSLTGWMESAQTSPKNAYLCTTGFFRDPGRAEEKITVPGAIVEVNGLISADRFAPVPMAAAGQAYKEVYEKQEEIWNSEILGPYETGGVDDLRRTSFKTVSSVTQNARGRQASRFRAYSIALQEEIILQISQAVAYVPWEEMIDIVGEKFLEVLPQDRRWWLHALRHQVAIIESPYTAVEADELFSKLNETGFWQNIVPLLPPPLALRFLSAVMPPGLAARAPEMLTIMREAAELLAQPPPEEEEAQEGEPPPEEIPPN